MTPQHTLSIVSTVIELLGLAAVIFGVNMLSTPVAIIVAGLVIVFIGYVISAPPPRKDAGS